MQEQGHSDVCFYRSASACLVKNTATVKGILHHSCLVSCCSFLQSLERSGSERQELHCMLALLVLWSGVEMDVYIRESLWPLEPYNDQKLRVASAKE